jgi:prolyl 4-hydroxylase
MLSREDSHVVKCVQNRAAEFQAFDPVSNIEPLQVVHYEASQEVRPHYDWLADESTGKVDRKSSFFAILDADCTECGTEFPFLTYDWEGEERGKLCEHVECGRNPMAVRAVAGNALFWRNVDENGVGHLQTMHSGLPLSNGTKTGLNIWTH